MIYAIQAVGTEFIKYGVAMSVGARLRNLRVASPHELVILATANWSNQAESRIHSLLRSEYVRGEWFRHRGLSLDIVRLMLENANESVLYALRVIQSERAQARLGKVIELANRRRE